MSWLLRDIVKKLRRKLGGSAANPAYIFTEPRVGYRMTATAATAVSDDDAMVNRWVNGSNNDL